MPIIHRYERNPVLGPYLKHSWEKEAAFNGCPIRENDGTHLVYRALSQQQEHRGVRMELSSIGYAKATGSALSFRGRRQLIVSEYPWEQYGCEDPRITKLQGKYYIFYTALSEYPFRAEGIKIGVAITDDLRRIVEKHLVTHFNAKAMALFPERIGGKVVAVLTVNTDIPPARICLAFFDKPVDLYNREYWNTWFATFDRHILPLHRSENDHVEVGSPPVRTSKGWLLIFSYIQNYFSDNKVFGIEAVLLDMHNPLRIKGRTVSPLFTAEEFYEQHGKVPGVVFPSGALVTGDSLAIYYGASDTTCCVATTHLSTLLSEMTKERRSVPMFDRYRKNPILSPIQNHAWEAKSTFNPGAFFDGKKIHIVYRAMSRDNTSGFGYAVSRNGFDISERLSDPMYVPREDFEVKKREGANSGCEDARLTNIEGTLYMLYTAHNGMNEPRVALTTISTDDFLNHKWHWGKPVLISPPGIWDKDACLLSEKVNGKFVVFHRMHNCIDINFVKDFHALGVGGGWLAKNGWMRPRVGMWDSEKVGIAAPPIRTRIGWILFYHGISGHDYHYRVGAVLLDGVLPSKILARTVDPLFEPEAVYEKEGVVPNVVFPCGAVVFRKKIFLYYGGADTVSGVATIPLRTLLRLLKS